MHWVKRGEHTDKYTLRTGKGDDAGSDATHYVPGTVMNLWVTTTHYDWKYVTTCTPWDPLGGVDCS